MCICQIFHLAPMFRSKVLLFYRKNSTIWQIFFLRSELNRVNCADFAIFVVHIIYRYNRIDKKIALFCRFFAQSVLFLTKVCYLCTDFQTQAMLQGVVRGKNQVLWKKMWKKLRKNFVVWNFFRYFAPRLVSIKCRCSSVGQSSWFVISWSGVRIPPSARKSNLITGNENMGRYQSGQMGQTVNLLAYAFGGSNPSLPTLKSRLELQPSMTDEALRCGLFLRK